jgi:sRNA-binding carbon storage regulator CsrA
MVTVSGFNATRRKLLLLIDSPTSVHVLREELKLF